MVRFREMGSRLTDARLREAEKGEVVFNECGVSVLQSEKSPSWMVVTAA